MEITKEMIKESTLINEGTTCYIIQGDDSDVYKIYKGALGYINGIDEYKLDENAVLNRLSYIVSKKKDVTLTDLPSEILSYGGKPVGVKIKYYNNSISLNEYLMEDNDLYDINVIKQQIMNIVGELIQNGIVPTDPHFGNFVICFNDDGTYEMKMIDTDDQYISVYSSEKRDVWYESEVMACYRVIELSFEKIQKNRRMK